jgi:hypothetical protein
MEYLYFYVALIWDSSRKTREVAIQGRSWGLAGGSSEAIPASLHQIYGVTAPATKYMQVPKLIAAKNLYLQFLTTFRDLPSC